MEKRREEKRRGGIDNSSLAMVVVTMVGLAAARLLLLFLVLAALVSVSVSQSQGQPFRCNSSPAVCQALVGYVPVNATTISAVQSLFSVKKFRSLLGANSLPPSTPRNFTIPQGQAFKVPIPCRCRNNTGVSDRVPMYRVRQDDGLYFIATTVFSGLVQGYQRIVEVNRIPNPNLIEVGQELWIPLPCSCDQLVNGHRVIHYTHVVQEGSTVELIAQTFGTDQQTLFQLNGIANDSQLIAATPFDVPLTACNSSIRTDSPDASLLISNGTYGLTAHGCVQCACASANNWTLQCQPSAQLSSANMSMCGPMQCEGPEPLDIGNTTDTACNRTTCAYNGFTDTNNTTTILTTLLTQSTCPVPTGSSAASRNGSGWSVPLLILVHLLLLTSHVLLLSSHVLF